MISTSTVTPHTKSSSLTSLKLSVSDLHMLFFQSIQKGLLFAKPPHISMDSLISLLKLSLSLTLTHFPPLAGRLITDSDGIVHVHCNDQGVDFIHAHARPHLSVHHILSPTHVPDSVTEFFPSGGEKTNYDGHYGPLLAVQVTELEDGVFIGCTVNHAIVDGTSFWNFFNSFAQVCKGAKMISKPPDFTRNFVKDSSAVLDGAPNKMVAANAPLKERIFNFSRESLDKLKSRANAVSDDVFELLGKQTNDPLVHQQTVVISSFQALCAQLWRSVTRARNLKPSKTTTFLMAVNCRPRLEPPIHPLYFGNAVQAIQNVASSQHVLSQDLHWSAELLHRNVLAHDDAKVRREVDDFEKNPRVFPIGNFDGATIIMGSSPRFPMYDNDFGWGRPLAIRSGRSNKFDGMMSAFPGREGGGTVDLEVCLAPETMKILESDQEFMQYVSMDDLKGNT